MIDKTEKVSYCLINGSFVPDDAREVLMTLINDKISFHERNHWSQQERFGESSSAVVKRIEELRQTKGDVFEWIENIPATGMKLNIRCNIEIALEPD